MNRYYIQAELGISKTVSAKSAANAKKNFLAKMEKDYPDVFEFIKDNISVTCTYVDPDQTHEGEREGWVEEIDRVLPTEDEMLLADAEKLQQKRGLAGVPRNMSND